METRSPLNTKKILSETFFNCTIGSAQKLVTKLNVDTLYICYNNRLRDSDSEQSSDSEAAVCIVEIKYLFKYYFFEYFTNQRKYYCKIESDRSTILRLIPLPIFVVVVAIDE